MQNKLSIILLCAVMVLGLGSCSVNARIKKADKKFAIGEYYEAGEIYRQTYKRVPSKDKKLIIISSSFRSSFINFFHKFPSCKMSQSF